MSAATVTSKGQITIPKRVRDHLGLKPLEGRVRDQSRCASAPPAGGGSDERSKWIGYLRGKLGGLARAVLRNEAPAYNPPIAVGVLRASD